MDEEIALKFRATKFKYTVLMFGRGETCYINIFVRLVFICGYKEL